MSDKYALTEEQQNAVIQRVVDLMLDQTQRSLTADEQMLVDMHLHQQTVDQRVAGMSAIVQRTIGTASDIGFALVEHVQIAETDPERSSVTIAWVLKLLARISDPTGKLVSTESLLESLPGHLRIDAEEFGFDPGIGDSGEPAA